MPLPAIPGVSGGAGGIKLDSTTKTGDVTTKTGDKTTGSFVINFGTKPIATKLSDVLTPKNLMILGVGVIAVLLIRKI